MKRQALALAAFLLILVTITAAKDPISRFFTVDKPEPLAGILTDQLGATIAGHKFQLLNEHKKVIKVVVTTAYGKYDFGILQPGRYRIRLKLKIKTPWCNPSVECSQTACRIAPLRSCESGY